VKIREVGPKTIKEVQGLEATVLDLQVAALGLQVFPQRTPTVQWRMRIKEASTNAIKAARGLELTVLGLQVAALGLQVFPQRAPTMQ
jgi:hypothetical protein